MASNPISSWQINGENMETVPDFIFLGSKISVDGDCSHAIKRRLLLGSKAMTNLNSILKSRGIKKKKKKSRGITLLTKICIVKAMVFPVWMWELNHKEGWTQKNWCLLNCGVEKTLDSHFALWNGKFWFCSTGSHLGQILSNWKDFGYGSITKSWYFIITPCGHYPV